MNGFHISRLSYSNSLHPSDNFCALTAKTNRIPLLKERKSLRTHGIFVYIVSYHFYNPTWHFYGSYRKTLLFQIIIKYTSSCSINL